MSAPAPAPDDAAILVINPGSTSTKVALYAGLTERVAATLEHSRAALSPFARIADQRPFRQAAIHDWLRAQPLPAAGLRAVIARGGLTRPIGGGVYAVNAALLDDLAAERYGAHPCNLGAGLAADFAAAAGGVPAYIADPPTVDELAPEARFSGLPAIERHSIFHALSQKAAARRAAAEAGLVYEEANFIVAHLGGGISVGAHRRGRVVDVNNALDGEGPFSPERSGTLPARGLARLCFAPGASYESVVRAISREAGLLAYLGSNDGRAIEARIAAGDRQADAVYDAMCYQIAKEIGALAAALEGDLAAIVLTGGLAHSSRIVDSLRRRVGFLAPLRVYPGQEELRALAAAALGALHGTRPVQIYSASS